MRRMGSGWQKLPTGSLGAGLFHAIRVTCGLLLGVAASTGFLA